MDSSSSPSNPSSLLDVGSPAERLCEPCYLILYAERPTAAATADPADMTPCANCSEPVGHLAGRDGSWVDVGSVNGGSDAASLDGWTDVAGDLSDSESESESEGQSAMWHSCLSHFSGSDSGSAGEEGGKQEEEEEEEEEQGNRVHGKEGKECGKSEVSKGDRGVEKGSKCSKSKKLKPRPSPAVHAAVASICSEHSDKGKGKDE